MNPRPDTRTYQATSLAEAIVEVKRDLGRDAVILETRRRRTGGLVGLLRRKRMWQVIASADMAAAPPRQGSYAPADAVEPDAMTPEPPAKEPMRISGVMGEELHEIRGMVARLLERQTPASEPNRPAVLQELYEMLVEQDVEESIAFALIEQLRESMVGCEELAGGALRERLADLVARRIRTVGPARGQSGRARTIALIGPTGVGKTTTAAKLAAGYKLRDGLSVGLVTIDTYRIAAVDQLKTYSDIIGIPLRVAMTAGELHQAIHSLSGCDVVLVDTAGRSQNDGDRLDELKEFVEAACPDEVHLVLAATAGRKTARRIMDRFAPVGADRILATKLDEAESFGTILNLSDRLPLSYVTDGQNVPDDLSAADAQQLAGRIAGGMCYVR